MVCQAFALSTLLTHTRTAQTLGYSIILIGFVFQVILCSMYAALIDLLYQTDGPAWVRSCC